MRPALFSILILLTPLIAKATTQEFRLDHLVVVVKDIEVASETYQKLGFALKPGRKHSNGLLNTFVKFRDDTEIELMSITSPANDEISREYAKVLAEQGESGAYVALSGQDIDGASERLSAAGIKHRITRGKLWDYLTFPPKSGLEHFFLIQAHKSFNTDAKYYEHHNAASGIDTVWVDDTGNVGLFLKALGGKPCIESSRGMTLSGTHFVLGPVSGESRPGFSGVGLSGGNNALRSVENAHGIWVRRGGVPCHPALNPSL